MDVPSLVLGCPIMNENLTEIAFVLDRSGSMENKRRDAINGFNRFLEDQKNEEGSARFSLFLFDHEYLPIARGVDIHKVEPLTEYTYIPRGVTALFDAVGRTIHELGTRLAALPEEERPAKIIVVILTDGLENSSTDYTADIVGQMIRHQQEKYAWEFIFLGASLDCVEQAEVMGVKESSTVKYDTVDEAFELSSAQVSAMRKQPRAGKRI